MTPDVEAARKVAADEYLTLADLNQASVQLLRRMTQQQADKFDMGINPDTGKPVAMAADATATGVDASTPAAPDRTHLNAYGQKVFGRASSWMQLTKTQVELGPDLIGVPGGPTTVQPGGPAGARPVPVPSQPAPPPNGN